MRAAHKVADGIWPHDECEDSKIRGAAGWTVIVGGWARSPDRGGVCTKHLLRHPPRAKRDVLESTLASCVPLGLRSSNLWKAPDIWQARQAQQVGTFQPRCMRANEQRSSGSGSPAPFPSGMSHPKARVALPQMASLQEPSHRVCALEPQT